MSFGHFVQFVPIHRSDIEQETHFKYKDKENCSSYSQIDSKVWDTGVSLFELIGGNEHSKQSCIVERFMNERKSHS